MGLHDRGYSTSVRGRPSEWTAVVTLIVATVAVFVACLVVADRLPIEEWLALWSDVARHPWRAFELVTYGFVHQPVGPGQSFPWHLVGNMLMLWFFGRAVEDLVGRAEFYRFYVTALVVGGLAWLVSVNLPAPSPVPVPLIGASGAVLAVLAVFVWNYPHTTVLIWGILPVPAWSLGVLYVVWDLQGAAHGGGNVAHVTHLAGAAFGLLYAWRGWDLGGLADGPRRLLARLRGGRRGMRVVRSDEDDDEPLQDSVDRILEKISRSGSSSLTPAERDTLARASQRLKDRQRMP
jgi:membrane associated rhomboid family serine protease